MKLLSKLNIWYYTYFIAYVLMIIVFGFFLKDKFAIDSFSITGKIIQYFVIFYMIASVPGALYGFKKKMKIVSAIENPVQQEAAYYKYAVIRMSMIAFGGIIAIIAFYLLFMQNASGGLVHNQSMLWCAAICVIAQYFCKPTERKVYLEMNDIRDEDIATSGKD